MGCLERVDKPNSVPPGSPAVVIIYLGRRLPAASSDQPKGQSEQPCGADLAAHALPSYLVLLPMGFA